MQHAVSFIIPVYVLSITDRTRFQAPVWWDHCQQILGKVAHQFQSKDYQGEPWTGAHHRTYGITVQCWVNCLCWEWYDWNSNYCYWLYRCSYCANLRYPTCGVLVTWCFTVGWDSDMSAILLLLHLLPPSAKGRKRPGKMSASQAVDHLIRFIKVCWTVFLKGIVHSLLKLPHCHSSPSLVSGYIDFSLQRSVFSEWERGTDRLQSALNGSEWYSLHLSLKRIKYAINPAGWRLYSSLPFKSMYLLTVLGEVWGNF